MTTNTSLPTLPSDIVESELEDMLQTVIDARCGLSAIHHLLDGAQTMNEIRTRFNQWQTGVHHTDGSGRKPHAPAAKHGTKSAHK